MDNMADNQEGSWRSQGFRQSVIKKIEEDLHRWGNPTTKSAAEMETCVFQKAKTRREYLEFVARLIMRFREMKGGIHPRKTCLCLSLTSAMAKKRKVAAKATKSIEASSDVSAPPPLDVASGGALDAVSPKELGKKQIVSSLPDPPASSSSFSDVSV